MTGYYDYVLGLIPAALLGVTAFLNLVGLSLTTALPGGAVVAFGIMAHAIFVRDPVAEAVRASGDRSVERSADPPVEQSAGRSVERSTSQSIEQSTGQSVDRSTRRSARRSPSD